MPREYDAIKAFDQAAVTRELVERHGFHEFIRQFWEVIQPGTPFLDNWHIGAIAEFVEALSRRQIINGVISIPPGSGKTKIVSVMWPMWVWTWQPWHRFLLGSWKSEFLTRDGNQSLDLLRSPLFQKCWPTVELKHSAPAAKYFENTEGGLRYASTPGVGATGEHGHTRACDDPMKAQDAQKDAAKEDVNQWWDGSMSSRRASGLEFGSLVTMQRLASDDLAAGALAAGAEHLCLPEEYVPRASWDMGCSLGKLDPRTEPGEMLWIGNPQRTREKIKELKRALKNPAAAEAQYQQNPVPDTGGIVERAWIHHWSAEPSSPSALPAAHLMRWITSWDLAFDGETNSQSRVAGGLFAACRMNGQNRYFCVRAFAKHMNYPQTKKRFRELLGGIDPHTRQRMPGDPVWKNARRHIIEKKANGAALLAEMKGEIAGLVSVSPQDSKGDRLVLHSDKFEAGEVWMPPEIVCPQIPELENEIVFFPNGDYDDFVDIVTQALDKLGMPNAGFWDKLRDLGKP